MNRKYAKSLGKRPLTVLVVVATRDKMVADLLEGHADVAVGNIKVLDELLKDVDFVAPDDNVASVEIVATGPASPATRRSTTCRARRSTYGSTRATFSA